MVLQGTEREVRRKWEGPRKSGWVIDSGFFSLSIVLFLFFFFYFPEAL